MAIEDPTDWRKDIWDLLKRQEEEDDIRPTDVRRTSRFIIIRDELYKRGFTVPLLKCLSKDETSYVID